jgi:hypothetical protein
MSDESSDNDQVWWMPADQSDPADQEEPLARAGWMHPARPIGPMGLRSGSRRPYILAGVAVAALLGGAGAALAATNSPAPAASSSAVITNPTPSPVPPGAAAPGPPGFRYFGRGPGFGGGLFGTLHGQFVIGKSGGGGYQTIDVQNGQVTAVSTTAITLKSADGFTKTYVVASSTLVDAQRDGIGSVKVGNQASVQATVSGSTATAVSIEDLTLLQQGCPAFGLGPSGGGGAQAG